MSGDSGEINLPFDLSIGYQIRLTHRLMPPGAPVPGPEPPPAPGPQPPAVDRGGGTVTVPSYSG
ncbi:hypothetical protein ACNJUL_21160, partial [Mycobacterium tuberculosis]